MLVRESCSQSSNSTQARDGINWLVLDMALFTLCLIRLKLESTRASLPSSGELTDATDNLKVRSSVGVQNALLEARHSSPDCLSEEHRQARGLVALPSDHDSIDRRSCNKAETLCSSKRNPESMRADGPYKWKGWLESSTRTLRIRLLGPSVKFAGDTDLCQNTNKSQSKQVMSNQGYGEGELPGADRTSPPKPEDIAARTEASRRHSRLGGPIHSERQMRIICIGAGASGLCFAYKLQRSFTNFSLTVYEKNAGVSGTWFVLRYICQTVKATR